jgi:hypothetical protein
MPIGSFSVSLCDGVSVTVPNRHAQALEDADASACEEALDREKLPKQTGRCSGICSPVFPAPTSEATVFIRSVKIMMSIAPNSSRCDTFAQRKE